MNSQTTIASISVFFSFLLFTGCSPEFCSQYPDAAPCQDIELPPDTPEDQPTSGEISPQKPTSESFTEKRETIFDVLWVINSDPPEGGASSTTLTIDPSSVLDIGFGGNIPNATGGLWETSTWMAATNVGFLLGETMQSYKIYLSVDSDTPIDGPSAGGMITTAILSLLRGDSIQSNVAMTGTINPDGTIGPVGGIPNKLEGAKEKNKSLVLIPYGQKSEEVIKQSRKLDITVEEVADIYEAYEKITGKTLPKAEPNTNDRIELSDAADQQILQKAKNWKSQYQSGQSRIASIRRSSIDEISEAIGALLNEAEASFSKAQSYEDNGDFIGAYNKYIEAVVWVESAAEIGRFFDLAENLDESAIGAQLENAWDSARSKVDSLLTRLDASEPQTASDAIALTQAYGAWSIAQGLLDYAENTWEQSSSDEEIGTALIWIVMSPALANTQISLGNDLLDLGLDEKGASLSISDDELQGFSKILESSATANLGFLDNLLAQKWGLTIEEIQQSLPSVDTDYAFAKATLDALSGLNDTSEEQKPYAKLGASLTSYGFSSRLIAKYYSLEAQLDGNNEVIGFERQRSLIHMLDFAEQRAEAVIRLAEDAGNNTNLLVLGYDGAKLAGSGSPADQINALGEFWSVTLSGKLMAIFSGQSLTQQPK